MSMTAGTAIGLATTALGVTGVGGVGLYLAQITGLPSDFGGWGWPAICGVTFLALIYTVFKIATVSMDKANDRADKTVERSAAALEKIAESIGGLKAHAEGETRLRMANGEKLDEIQQDTQAIRTKVDA